MAQFDTTAWRISAAESRIEEYQGRQALYLRDGVAWLTNRSLRDGTIEFDLAVSDSQGFHGVMFRAADERNAEHYYIRPHLAGDPDATQYNPIFNGVSGWQIYVGDRYTAPLRFPYDAWMHVKLVVQGPRAVVYIDGREPVQYVPALVRPPASGMVALTSSFAPARFANVVVRETVTDPIPERMIPAMSTPAGAVMDWNVSGVFAERDLATRDRLGATDVDGLSWSRTRATERGIVNLATVHGVSRDTNTVFAAVTVHAAVSQTTRLRFGFSDRVRIYLNGRLLFSGDDGWQTRDHRFLGTIGLFDELNLALQPGANTLLFAVSEGFGGWGITAAFEEASGLRVEPGCGKLMCVR